MNTIGHNQPPPFDVLKEQIESIVAEANRALSAVKEIADEETAKKFDGFENKIGAVLKDAESQRRAEKKPHDDAAKAVQEKYAPLISSLETAKKMVKALLGRWLLKKDEERKRAAREAEEEALKAMREAEEAQNAAAAGKGDIVGAAVAAEEAVKKAEEAVAKADKIANANVSVKSDYSSRARALKVTWSGNVVDQDAAYTFLRNEPDLMAEIARLVNAKIRHAPRKDDGTPDISIPGVELVKEAKAA